jgi:hypothetical protein
MYCELFKRSYYMYNNNYRNFEQFDEFDELDQFEQFDQADEVEELDSLRGEDEDEFTGFVPPYDCPLYRQQFPFPGGPGGGFTPPRPTPRPPFGPPSGGPGGFPGGGPGGQQGAPSGPPPNFIPSKAQAQSLSGGYQQPGLFAVDAGSLRPCLFRFTYIWLRNGNAFWAWLTFVGRRSVSGFRWNGRRWMYFGVDTRRIDFFVCR